MRGDRMREARETLKLTQEELAELTGLEPLQIWRYESGKFKPKSDVLSKIAAALNVSTDWLVGLTEHRTGHFGEDLSEQETEIVKAIRTGDKIGAIKAIVGGE